MLTISVLEQHSNTQNDRSDVTGISEINNVSEESKENKEYIDKKINALLRGEQQPQHHIQKSSDHEGIHSTHVANRWKKTFLSYFIPLGFFGIHIAGILAIRALSHRLI
jgi:hypothetical protein